MKTRQSSKRGCPPDEAPRPRKTSRALTGDEVVPETESECSQDEIVPETDSESFSSNDRSTARWALLKQQLRDAFRLLRAFLFIHMEDDRVWLRIRGFLQFRNRSISWLALLRLRTHQDLSLPELLEELNVCVPKNKTEDLNREELENVLSALLSAILSGDVKEFRPLFEKNASNRWRHSSERSIAASCQMVGTCAVSRTSNHGSLFANESQDVSSIDRSQT